MSFNKEIRKVEYEKFYIEKGIDKTKILKEYETEDGMNDGYMCICCYCLNRNTNDCTLICCRDGKPCQYYNQNEIVINRDKQL